MKVPLELWNITATQIGQLLPNSWSSFWILGKSWMWKLFGKVSSLNKNIYYARTKSTKLSRLKWAYLSTLLFLYEATYGARFISLFILISSYIAGQHKRDDFSRPILDTDDFKLDYLRKSVLIFKEWQASKRSGLSHPTFTAVIQSFSALIDLSIYLLERHSFSFVLLGKFQSDPLEGRFGYYRQLSGGNFYISCRQLLQAEKKIRLLNEMQVNLNAYYH